MSRWVRLGDLWVDVAAGGAGPELPPGVFVQPTPPADDEINSVWLDDDTDPVDVYGWDGAAWVLMNRPSPVGAYTLAVLADAPIGYWPMDETAGATMADASGNARDGVYSGSPTLGGPGPGSGTLAPTFNGSTWGVVTDTTPFRTPNFTAEVWVKTTDPTSCILAHPAGPSGIPDSGFNLFTVSSKCRLETDHLGTVDSISSPANISDGAWHHVAATYDGTTRVLYVDGVSVATDAPGGAMQYNPLYSLGIGVRHIGGATDYPITGSVCQAALYDVVLSGARIAAHQAAMGA